MAYVVILACGGLFNMFLFNRKVGHHYEGDDKKNVERRRATSFSFITGAVIYGSIGSLIYAFIF